MLEAFVRTSVPDPLLCLTVSATLREKAAPQTPSRQVLTDLATSLGPEVLESVNNDTHIPEDSVASNDDLGHLYEINLLDGLSAGISPH